MKQFYTLYYIFFAIHLFAWFSANSQTCNTAILVSLPFSATVQTTCGEGDDYNSGNVISCGSSVFNSGEDVLYSFTPSSSGYILITFSSSQTQTGIFLYEGCPDNGICVSSNTAYSTTNSIGFNATANTSYSLIVDNWAPPTCITSFDLSITVPGKKMPSVQDCNQAIPICSDTYVQPNSYSGTGSVPNEIPASSCLINGEKNSVWYTLQEQTTGNLSFTITPISLTDDYDWAVYNISNTTCEEISTNPALEISCNSSGSSGSTGANGQSGGQNNPVIPVQSGDIYVILIVNYWPTQSGYTLDFSASSSQLYDTIGPQFSSIESIPVCADSTIKVKFTDNVVCSSVSTSDFKLIGPGGPYTITGFYAEGCDMGADYDKYYSFTTSPTITDTGDYYFIMVDSVTDVCGNVCNYPDTLPFTIAPIIISSSITASDCQDSTGSIALSISGGSGAYSYLWQPTADTTSSISNVASGSYIITVTDEYGCTENDTLLVQDKNAASIEIDSYQEPTCNGYSNGFVSVSILSGTPNYKYLWNDPNAQQGSIAQGLKAGYYCVKVTDGLGCNAIADTLLLEPDSIVTTMDDTISICESAGATIVVTPAGGTPPYDYNWNSLLLGNSNTQTVYPQSITTYTVSVTDVNGCAATTDSSIVTFYNSMSVLITGDSVICANDSLVLLANVSGGGAPYNYTWSDGFTTDSMLTSYPPSAGSYWVNVTDVCADTLVADSFSVNILVSSNIDFDADVLNGCAPLLVQMDVDTTTLSGATYYWEFNGSSSTSTLPLPSHLYTVAGIYNISLTITFANGCSSTTDKIDYIEVYPSPTAGFTYSPDEISIQNPECVFTDTSQNAISWAWFVGDSLFSTEQNPSLTFSSGGIYSIMQVGYNINGCTDTAFKNIEVVETMSIQFPTGFSHNGDGLNDNFSPLIYGAESYGYSFIICDRWGAVIFNTTDIDQAWDGLNNGKEIPSGAYSYKVRVRDLLFDEYVYMGMVTLVK